MDIAIPIELIINQLVSNTLKYAFQDPEKGEVKVALNTFDHVHFVLMVQGLPHDFYVDHSTSFWIGSVKNLARQLNGDYKFSRGTIFTLVFTIENPNSFNQYEPTSENFAS